MIKGVKCDGEKNKRSFNFCVAQHDRSGGGSVIMWGVIFYSRVHGVLSHLERTRIRYRNEDLYPIVKPFSDVICTAFVLAEITIDHAKETSWTSTLRQIL